MNIGTKLNIKH